MNITRNLELEIVSGTEAPQRALNVFWGLEPTGVAHIGYLAYILSLKSQLSRGNHVKVLLADSLALFNNKDPLKVQTYCDQLERFFRTFDSRIEILRSSNFLKDLSYWTLYSKFFKINMSLLTRSLPDDIRAKLRLGPESINFGSLAYAIFQAIDGHYLNLDRIYAGKDQRPVYMLLRKTYGKLGWNKPQLVLFPLLTLEGIHTSDHEKKISASKDGSKFALDKSLYLTLERYLEGQKLDDHESFKLRKLKNIAKAMVNIERFKEFTDEQSFFAYLKLILEPLKNFEFS